MSGLGWLQVPDSRFQVQGTCSQVLGSSVKEGDEADSCGEQVAAK